MCGVRSALAENDRQASRLPISAGDSRHVLRTGLSSAEITY